MEAEFTCGMGIAENAVLPAKLADLTAAMAAVLEGHQLSLDRADADSRLELAAYQRVAQALRKSADQLKATATEMAASRTVPMGRHDDEALSSKQAVEAFATFVAAEEDLLSLLQARVGEHNRMLVEMRGPGTA